MLALGPEKRLLEVGTGSGWPGLYLASITGCDVALIDLPFEGLRIAAARAASDRIAERCWPVMADGAALPFGANRFDAIFHSDVLCCLETKLAVLKECRRAVRDVDMTAEFFETVRNLLQQEEAYADELTELLGEGKFSEQLTKRRKRLEGIELGLIRRELFSATPAPNDEYGQ